MGLDVIIQGDCIDVMKGMEDESVDMVMTDIPYGVITRPSAGLRNFDKGNADKETFSLQDFVESVSRVISGSCYVFCATEQVSELRERFIDAGMSTRLGIWEKTNPPVANGQHLWLSGVETCIFARKPRATFNEHCKNTVWRYPINADRLDYPTVKPVKLFQYLISVSTNVGDLVLDPCIGSGTTAIACIRSSRHYIGIELEQRFVDLSNKRIRIEQAQLKLDL